MTYNSINNNEISEEDEGFSEDDSPTRKMRIKKSDYKIKVVGPPLKEFDPEVR